MKKRWLWICLIFLPFVTIAAIALHWLDDQAAHNVNPSLWRSDPGAAASAAGWRPIPQDEWGFTATMPPDVEVKKSPQPDPATEVVVHYYSATQGSITCFLAAREYPERVANTLTEKNRLSLVRGMLTVPFQGTISDERAVELQGRTGREFDVQLEGSGAMRTRAFWVGNRFYILGLADKYKLIAGAADYYLDSFRLPEKDVK